MSEIYGWIRGIVSYLCIFQVILQLLPTGNFKKYVHFFGNLLLLLLVLGPFGRFLELSNGFEQIWKIETMKNEVEEMRQSQKGLEELKLKQLEEAYETEIKRQIEEMIKSHGFSVKKVDLILDNEGKTGEIKEINLRVALREESSNNAEESVNQIKKEVQEVYHISLEHINVSIQG